MDVSELIAMEHILLDVEVSCAKKAFTEIARITSQATGISERNILDALLERERLGCTAVGDGVSIPHARIEGLENMTGCFVRLKNAVDMDAPDGKPVDIMFVLLAPADANSEHLKAMARISRLLRDSVCQDALRAASSSDEIYVLLTQHDAKQKSA